MPPTATSMNSLVIPDVFKLTSDGREFLLRNTGSEPDRIIVFVTRDDFEEMARSSRWFMDGAFKTTPLLFAQVYTIHVLKQGQTLPMVFALLPNEVATTYESLFCTVKARTATSICND
jgi:hypothetical protein